MDSESSLEVLNPKYNEYRSLNENLGQRVLFLDVKAIVLAATYIIVLIIMYAQLINPLSSLLLQRNTHFWIQACLLASVVAVFWPAFIHSVNDCVRTRQQRESTFVEQEKVYRKIYSIRTGRRRDSGAVQQSLAKALASVSCQRYACVGAMHFGLIVFTLLVSYALLFFPSNFSGNGLPQIHLRIEVPPSAAIQFVSAR